MSTTSKPRRRFGLYGGLAALAALILAACIQGPWDYYPKNPEVFRGLYASGYVLAGKPVEHVCFERVLDLSEEATQAFAFYDSAEVRIAGRFGGVETDLSLTAMADTPNCFRGNPADTAERGGDYALTARMVWDSAGTRITRLLTATAHMPGSFSIHRTAAAPSIARNGGIPDNIFTPQFFASLPPRTLAALTREFPEGVQLLQADPPDTAELNPYIKKHGGEITDRLKELLESEPHYVYDEGDTLVYINGVLNTLSHYYASDRSPDVKAVLIAQRFDTNSSRPQTQFDSFLGQTPDSSEYYFPGDIRRLIIYQDAKSRKGWNLLDSLGVVNTWFHTQRNRLYFFGFEQAYYDYISTSVENAGADVRVKPKYNVKGGNGFFVAGIPDSFDVYIKTDSLTKSYPLQITHGLFCDKDGWTGSKDCREYYPGYCSERGWNPPECAQGAVTACLGAAADGDTALQARCSARAASAAGDTSVAARGENQFCIERGFADSLVAVCAGAAGRCLETKGANACKQAFWDYCLDHSWRAPACDAALASYCHDKPRLSETLCKQADIYCAAHPGSVLCK